MIPLTINDCSRCRLHELRNTIVNGSGNTDSGIMLIGEAPGEDEDKSGIPFVGKAGKVLDELLPLSGVCRSSVYVTNVVKCRPPRNRKPAEDEIGKCMLHLVNELKQYQPKVIILLGQTACDALHMGITVGKYHGQRAKCNVLKKWVFVSYHPAAVLYKPELLSTVQSDFAVFSKDIINTYPNDVKRGQRIINDLYSTAELGDLAAIERMPGEYSFVEPNILSHLDATVSYWFYKTYKKTTNLREFYHLIRCSYIHGEDTTNYVGALLNRLEQTLTLYDACMNKPGNTNLIKALVERGIQSKVGREFLLKKAGFM